MSLIYDTVRTGRKYVSLQPAVVLQFAWRLHARICRTYGTEFQSNLTGARTRRFSQSINHNRPPRQKPCRRAWWPRYSMT